MLDGRSRVVDRAGEQTGRNRSIKPLQATLSLAMVTTIPDSSAKQWFRSFPSCLKVCWQTSTHGSRPMGRTADRTFTNTISIITQRVKAHGWNQELTESPVENSAGAAEQIYSVLFLLGQIQKCFNSIGRFKVEMSDILTAPQELFRREDTYIALFSQSGFRPVPTWDLFI